MKRVIYGALVAASLAACWIFFFNPPRTGNDAAPSVLAITFQFPEGYEFTEGAPFTLAWQAEGSDGKITTPIRDNSFNPLMAPYLLKILPETGARAVRLKARLYYCEKASRMCFQGDFETRVPLIQGLLPKAWVWKIEPKKNGMS